MKILLVTNKVPFPPKDGGAIATLHMALGLQNAGARITIAAISTPKHPDTSNDIPNEIKNRMGISTVFVNTNISLVSALQNFFFSKKPYNAERFISNNFVDLLNQLLSKDNFDFIQLEGLYLTPYIPTIRRKSGASISLRAHNVESEIWERTASNEKNFLKRAYLKHLARRIKRMEINALQDIDILIPISLRDEKMLKQMGYNKKSFTCPTGYQINNPISVSEDLIYPSIFHIGGLDWMPNQEGLIWFLENCWNSIREQMPGITFYIAGRNASKEFVKKLQSFQSIVFLGEIADSKEFMSSKAVMVVPLLSGSGMRIKIVEGMALGKAIVSTPIGAEGIEAIDGEEIMIASSASSFIDKTLTLLQNKETCLEMGIKAMNFAKQKLDNNKLVKDLFDFYMLEKKI